MDNSKPWYASTTIWGGVIALAASVASMFGHSVSAADQATLMSGVVQVAGGIGGVVAIIGRLVAKKTIGSAS